MKKVYITPKNKGLNYQKFFSELPIVKAVSLGAVMAGLLSSVSPVFASHLSSAGSKVQSVSAGVVSANVAHGRVGVANGDRSCGVDQVISRGLSSGKKVSAKEQYKKLTKNQLSDGPGGYSFESGCGADASVNALTNARARSSINVDGATNDWFLEENNTINWSVNTRSVNTTGTRVAGGQMRGTVFELVCGSARRGLCIGEGTEVNDLSGSRYGIALGYQSRALREDNWGGYDPKTNATTTSRGEHWQATAGELSVGDSLRTRVITNVSAGWAYSDAVNVAQLKELRGWVVEEGGTWKLSVNDKSSTVNFEKGLNLIEGKNIKISSNDNDNKVTFGLDDNLKVSSISIESDGPKIDGSGINAGNKSIKNVAKGKISEDSQEAVTGKQLYDTNTTVAKYLGGGAKYDNKWTEPTFKVQQKEYRDVGAAFAGVDKKLTELSEQVVGGGVAGDSLVQQDESNVITIGKEAKGNEISIAGSEGSRKLTGLAEGAVSGSSTDAVTGKQLNETNTTVAKYLGGKAAYEGGKWTEPTFTITDFGVQSKNGKQTYNNVADAFEAVNSSMSGLNDRIKKVEQQTGSSVNSNSLNWDEGKNAYSASHSGQAGKITNVANGDIGKDSTDVVTGSQLWAMNEEIDSLKDKVDNIVISGGGTLTTEGVVTYDKDKPNTITLAGTDDDTPVLIDNVADGEIEEGSKQAVNGGQLKEQMGVVLADANKYTDEKIGNMVNDAVAQANAYTDMKFEALNYRVEGVQKEARQAAAIGLAVANLHYIETPGMLSVAFGSGVWRGQSALAFGAGYMSEDGKMRSNFSVTTSGGHWGVGAGLSLALK
ncbi:YadA-like family protein [Bartonella schoenbuchensis]|uniref:YadA-like family protein n=1 Tax=Bartonella schoenbuchensis TaxID=165694 RepID=UPI001ABB1208|nr:YadA-like family protein [Bartonella schoenbuchensis]